MAIATPAASELDDLIAASQGPMFSMFYVVSQRKLAILFLSTYTACHKRKHPKASRFSSTISEFRALLPLWPVFMSYVLSFVYIGIYWNKLQYVNHPSLAVNARPVASPTS
jgi:hypothetical protein